MGSAGEGTVEHRPSQLKCHQHCLFALRKELKFILATHIILTDVSGLVEAPAYNQVERGGAVSPSRPIAKSATVSSTFFPLQSGPSTRSYNNKSDNNCNYIFWDIFMYNFYVQDQMHLARIVLW